MILDVRHRTTYHYAHAVSVSHHVLHLVPRGTVAQIAGRAIIDITPEPSWRVPDTDYFGNATTFVTIESAHRKLVIEARSRVDVRPRTHPKAEATPRWEQVVQRLQVPRTPAALDAADFMFPSSHVPLVREIGDYAKASFAPGRSILAASTELSHRIHEDFTYDSTATTLATPVAEAFALRRGVCQDFAHVGVAALRAMGLAARYVSGYLLTRPPEGKPRLVGADASHAWFAVWLGDAGWLDLDPTNDCLPGEGHVTLAWGRDYADVAPVSGVMFGGGKHALSVAVDVVPVSERAG